MLKKINVPQRLENYIQSLCSQPPEIRTQYQKQQIVDISVMNDRMTIEWSKDSRHQVGYFNTAINTFIRDSQAMRYLCYRDKVQIRIGKKYVTVRGDVELNSSRFAGYSEIGLKNNLKRLTKDTSIDFNTLLEYSENFYLSRDNIEIVPYKKWYKPFTVYYKYYLRGHAPLRTNDTIEVSLSLLKRNVTFLR